MVFSPEIAHLVIRIQPLKHLGQFLLHELPGSRFPKKMSSFLFQHQMSEPLQRSQITQHVGGILETLQVHIGIAAVGGHRKTEPHPGLRAHCREAGIISVHEVVPEHQPEVTGMVKSKGDKRETQCAYVRNDIVGVLDFLNVTIKQFKR